MRSSIQKAAPKKMLAMASFLSMHHISFSYENCEKNWNSHRSNKYSIFLLRSDATELLLHGWFTTIRRRHVRSTTTHAYKTHCPPSSAAHRWNKTWMVMPATYSQHRLATCCWLSTTISQSLETCHVGALSTQNNIANMNLVPEQVTRVVILTITTMYDKFKIDIFQHYEVNRFADVYLMNAQ